MNIHDSLEDQIINQHYKSDIRVKELYFKEWVDTYNINRFGRKIPVKMVIEGDIDVMIVELFGDKPDKVKIYECKSTDRQTHRDKAASQLEKELLYVKTLFQNVLVEMYYKTPTCTMLYDKRRI